MSTGRAPGAPPQVPTGQAPGDDEGHLAALLAVLALTPTEGAPGSTPLEQWRARRRTALERHPRN